VMRAEFFAARGRTLGEIVGAVTDDAFHDRLSESHRDAILYAGLYARVQVWRDHWQRHMARTGHGNRPLKA
jgi:hypothetical protein